MEKLFFEYPKTIGKELQEQLAYRITIDKKATNIKGTNKILNGADLSTKIIKMQKKLFDFERKDYDEYSTRTQTITDLSKIDMNEEIPKYILLFCAFKVLNIIKEDNNIIKLFDYYHIQPKKEVEKKRIQYLKNKNEQHCVSMCCRCISIDNKRCENYDKCPFRKLKKELDNISDVDEKMKLLYRLGFPSNWIDILMLSTSKIYDISMQTLKNILKYLEMFDCIKSISFMEKNYKNYLKIVKESRDEWKDEMQEQKIIIEKLENTKNLKELQELTKIEEAYMNNKRYLERSNSEQLKKMKPYYFSRIEDECHLKQIFPKKTIH